MKLNYVPHTQSSRPTSRAFTLVELLLVLVILGILAAIVVPKFAGRTEQARVAAAKTQITQFGTALDSFEVDTGHYPKNLSELLVLPSDAQNWHGPYMKIDAVPKDPWQNDYIYKFPGTHNPSSYDLMSAGPDGRVNTEDDIANWTIKK
jgi:general secretion pathway protein G